MKITDELKSKVNAAESLDEKKAILSAAGVELSDDEMDDVAGGRWMSIKAMETSEKKKKLQK